MTTPQPADVRWSPSENVLYLHPVDAPDRWVCQPAAPRRAASWAVPSLPADAVRLIPDETNNDALMAYAMKWQAERAAGIPRGAITAAESVTGNYLMNYDPANGDLHSLARAIVAEIAGALVVLPGDAPAVDGAGTATPTDPASLSDTQLTQLRRHVEEGYSVRPGDVSLTFADMLGEIEKLHARIAAVVVRCYEADRTTFTTSTHPGYVDSDEIRSLLAGGEQQ